MNPELSPHNYGWGHVLPFLGFCLGFIKEKLGDWDWGGHISEKQRGGENIEFPVAPEIDPFYRDSRHLELCKRPSYRCRAADRAGNTPA